jgi:predicted acylesterase/phospholipase RssA
MNARRALIVWVAAICLTHVFASNAQAATKCAQTSERALVLSGGGAKGAFEAGAIFHFVNHRDCDFRDIAGVSVGALNGAYLAEAALDENSLSNLQQRTRDLVDFWRSISGPGDILHPRFLGKLRFFLFGLDSLNDFTPLQKIIEREVHPTKIREGNRSLRVGVVSFYDGVYHEVDPRQVTGDGEFRKYVLASASIPVNARLPRIPTVVGEDGTSSEVQYADGGVSHTTPLVAYFSPCDFSPKMLFSDSMRFGRVTPCVTSGLQEHDGPIKELFVVVANPYDPASTSLDPKKTAIDDGREILARTLDVLTTSPYRWDLNFALAANRMLRWRQKAYAWAKSIAPEDKAREVLDVLGEGSSSQEQFPVRSANPGPEGFSLPYEMGIVAPSRVYADTYGFDKANIRLQLHKGCVHADLMLVREFGMDSMRKACDSEFPVTPQQLKDDPDPPLEPS